MEQLCLFRADVDALHSVLAFLGHNDDVKIERVEQIREAVRDQAYRKIRAEVLAQISTNSSSEATTRKNI